MVLFLTFRIETIESLISKIRSHNFYLTAEDLEVL